MGGPAGITIRLSRAEELAALAAIADEGAPARPENAGAPIDRKGRLSPARLAACRAEGLLWTAADGADESIGVLAATIADTPCTSWRWRSPGRTAAAASGGRFWRRRSATAAGLSSRP